MLSNLAENLYSSAKLKIRKEPKFEVSNSKNKDLVTQCTFQKVWKILLYFKTLFYFQWWFLGTGIKTQRRMLGWHSPSIIHRYVIFGYQRLFGFKVQLNRFISDYTFVYFFFPSQLVKTSCLFGHLVRLFSNESFQRLFFPEYLLNPIRHFCAFF